MSRAYARRQNDGIAPQTTENETLPLGKVAFRFRWFGYSPFPLLRESRNGKSGIPGFEMPRPPETERYCWAR